MKKLTIFGSTGSIGQQTLDVIRSHKNLFSVVAISGQKNIDLLEKQINEFKPKIAVVCDNEKGNILRSRYSGDTKIFIGKQHLTDDAVIGKADIVLNALTGFAGFKPTLAAIEAKKRIALANKETLVVAGDIVMKLAHEKKVEIIPIDSEHSAIFQCLNGENKKNMKKILLIASGGPFFGKSKDELEYISVEEALKHPNWNMGMKISIDSATLANKGLEVIEAKHLFDMPVHDIIVLVHKQSIVHSMVEFKDNNIIAQLGLPDMRIPIQYALTYPKRISVNYNSVDFFIFNNLTFEKPDLETFRCLKLAYECGAVGENYPCIFNAVNEVAVEAFLNKKVKFLDIPNIIETILNKSEFTRINNINEIFLIDNKARIDAKNYIKKI